MAKVSKASVHFEHPAKGPNHCGMCRHFEPPHECSEVEGNDIERGDWCEKFKKKSPYTHPRSQRRR